jgi:hypothetical protein
VCSTQADGDGLKLFPVCFGVAMALRSADSFVECSGLFTRVALSEDQAGSAAEALSV